MKVNIYFVIWNQIEPAQMAGAIEYVNCISAEG